MPALPAAVHTQGRSPAAHAERVSPAQRGRMQSSVLVACLPALSVSCVPRSGETLTKGPGEISGQQFSVTDVQDCTVQLLDHSDQVSGGAAAAAAASCAGGAAP